MPRWNLSLGYLQHELYRIGCHTLYRCPGSDHCPSRSRHDNSISIGSAAWTVSDAEIYCTLIVDLWQYNIIVHGGYPFTQDINLERLPFELYGGQDTKVHERGLLGFAQLYRYTQMFTALQKLGFNTTELTLFKLLTKEILTDACNWVS